MYTENDLVGIAKRENNNKRKYLVVNKIQGKHVPANPKETLKMFDELAKIVKEEYVNEKVLLVGFAETATAIGSRLAVDMDSYYMQTTRENIEDVEYLYFTESHSHATEQKFIKTDLDKIIDNIQRIVFVEDEVTTGNTILKIIDIIQKTYQQKIDFSVASILNGMDEASKNVYDSRNIKLHYLVKTDHGRYSDIADKYMLHIAEHKSNNLRVTGRALFFLAVLLKLKSNVLVGIDPMQFEIQQEFDPEYDDDDSRFNEDLYYQDFPDNVIPIEDIIQRRTSVKLNRNRIVTLKDLIRQLEFYEQLDKKQAVKNSLERAQQRRVRSYKNMSADDIINMAHEEYIESSVKILHENLTKIFEKEEKVELNTLTLLGLDKISAYIALLFLTVESEFDLEQDEFYSDLYVVKGKAPTRNFEEEQTA